MSPQALTHKVGPEFKVRCNGQHWSTESKLQNLLGPVSNPYFPSVENLSNTLHCYSKNITVNHISYGEMPAMAVLELTWEAELKR